MIIHNQRSLIAIHNERDREDFIDEKVKAQGEASMETVMEMSAMIDTQAQIFEGYKQAMATMAMEMTEMMGAMQVEIASLKEAK